MIDLLVLHVGHELFRDLFEYFLSQLLSIAFFEIIEWDKLNYVS